MHRECVHCGRTFTPKDLVKDESRGMEADRKAYGLEGVRFLYYSCPECGFDEIIVDIHPLEGEGADDFLRRRGELEKAVREFHGEKVEAVLSERA
jgi:DNA-directed RNA polymerase subunit RPC12/RpoP